MDVGAGDWPNGISVNTDKCRELGMKERFANVLASGSDLLLKSVPVFDSTRDNYSSALEELEAVSTMINEQVSSGILESPFNDVRLVNSLGVVRD